MYAPTAKEIHIRHGAPVVSITVVDRTLQPLKATSAVVGEDQPLSPGLTGGHRVVICTQEQLKVTRSRPSWILFIYVFIYSFICCHKITQYGS